MENIENKLNDYRLKKRKRGHLQQLKRKMQGFFKKEETNNSGDEKIEISDDISEISGTGEAEHFEYQLKEKHLDERLSTSDKVFKYTLWSVYLAFWITLDVIAVKFGFGIVFLMLSALMAIYYNTRTGPRTLNEISAYSVFNKNCESIDGTLKAEHFERQIGIR